MALSDRSQYKLVEIGSLGSSPTIVNAPLCIAQDAQRYHQVGLGVTSTTAATNYNFSLMRTDRPMQVKEVRILPGAALTFIAANYVTLSYGYTNDGGGSVTTMGSINTANTAANGGTGNWAVMTSIVIPPNTLVNSVIPSGSFVTIQSIASTVGIAIPGLTQFQMIAEEV
jgi:hypothetical protein